MATSKTIFGPHANILQEISYERRYHILGCCAKSLAHMYLILGFLHAMNTISSERQAGFLDYEHIVVSVTQHPHSPNAMNARIRICRNYRCLNGERKVEAMPSTTVFHLMCWNLPCWNLPVSTINGVEYNAALK